MIPAWILTVIFLTTNTNDIPSIEKYNFKTKTTKSTRVTIKTAQSRKRYYVRVRAYKLDENKNKVYGSWSKVKRVKVR